MRELNHPGAFDDDYGDQTGTGRQYRFLSVFPAPIRNQFWYPSREVERDQFRELLDPERTTGHRETLQKSIRVLPVRIIDVFQNTLVCLIQRLGQFLKGISQIGRKAVP